ncbi:TPA: restriction endonuclease subunit S [Vibrio cholerae]|uniref:restriction endonuclease subunit S n=1 Tax=Vibrio cholerae TaxID=666 RepID=UPI0004E4595C|nr:restriction endonuclease subunit S [Vibrio cholerae]EMC8699069.1 restriction endonuclease subunit S [Vibrio cholerae]KFD93793.1 type I restriction modification DNA specificity domain protein [Vibrio cholerae]KNA53352.1 type I restriction modification DNA specificity domain-containing protein [Vibrio cholerae V51]GIB73792.1 restriction endonuclease subunit S [Vibrio cholerae]HCF7742361.1 restriction endonuclease subunit S [Vibrio cholerae]
MEQVLYKLPDGWKRVCVDDVCTKITDGAHKTPKYTDDGVPFLSVKDVNKGLIDFSNTRFVSQETHDDLYKRCNPERNDILYTKVGSTGVAKIVDTDREFSLFVSVALLKPKSELIDSKYFEYALNSPESYAQAQALTRGVANRNLVLKDIKSITFNFAPIKEQKRIVEKLDALLTRIDTAIEHLQESVTLKNSLLQSALDGQFSAITERMTIESLAEVKGGKRLPKGEKLSDEETEHPYIRVADFTDKGTIDLSGIKYISKEIHEQIKRYVISKDDLYISIAGTIGKTGFVPSELDGANLTENAAKLVIKDKQQLDLSYLYLFTLTSDFSAQAGLATKTVAQPKLALTRLSKIEIPICSLEEQKSLVSTIEALKSKIHDAEAVLLGKIEDLKSLKASILDSAFKGEL